MSFTETQANPFLLDSSFNISNDSFQSDNFVVQSSNNKRKIIGKRKQDGIILAVRGLLHQFTKSGESDPSGLGTWNSLDRMMKYKVWKDVPKEEVSDEVEPITRTWAFKKNNW